MNRKNEGVEDIPNGFQDISPETFVLLGELLGNVMAGKMPFNVQNAIGNWLMLLAQAIEVMNAQQQYFQSGPGRYYNPNNENVANSYVPGNEPKGGIYSADKKDNSQRIEYEKLKVQVEGLKKIVKEYKKEIKSIGEK